MDNSAIPEGKITRIKIASVIIDWSGAADFAIVNTLQIRKTERAG
jgi:hypothetical protein